MQTLDQYLRDTGETNEAFGRRVGLHPVSVSRIRNGAQRPSYDRMVKIEAETGGKVPLTVWAAPQAGAA